MGHANINKTYDFHATRIQLRAYRLLMHEMSISYPTHIYFEDQGVVVMSAATVGSAFKDLT